MRLKYIFAAVLLLFAVDVYALSVTLNVKEQMGQARTGEMVHNGIPIAKSENLLSTSSLIVKDGETQVPATFEVLGRYGGAPGDTGKPIHWLMVSFPASVGASSSKSYTLTTGTPIARSDVISYTSDASEYSVTSGGATFVIDKTTMTVFKSISLNGNTVATGGGSAASTFNGQAEMTAGTPTWTVERDNDHYLCIKAAGTYPGVSVGTAISEPMYYKIRYIFHAGSPVAEIYYKFYWPGSSGEVTTYTVDNVNFKLPAISSYSGTDVYANTTTYYTNVTGESAAIAQRRKAVVTDPNIAEVSHGATTASTEYASGNMLIARGTNGAIGVTIDHMQDYAPQSMACSSTGDITVNTLAEGQFFCEYQGTWSRVAVAALPSDVTYNTAYATVAAPLNERLFASSASDWTNGALLGSPDPSSTNTDVVSYKTHLSTVTSSTPAWLRSKYFQGLMTWGTAPRYEGEIGSTEVTTWDRVYSGASMTDYHNASSAYYSSYVLGNDINLYDTTYPAARRVMHTQIFQPNAAVSSVYMGWCKSGYQRFRADTNSSHSYFLNLYNYYFLTGDTEVIDLLKVAGENRRAHYTRAGDILNAPTTPTPDWTTYFGRVAMQHASIFHFLGSTYDSSFNDDYKHMFAHAFSKNIVLLNANGTEYGFISDEDGDNRASGFSSTQSWMTGTYFMRGLQALFDDVGDIELGADNIRIGRFAAAIARTMRDYNATVDGDGTWSGTWANSTDVTYSGDPIGGTVTTVITNLALGGDKYLWSANKPAVMALVATALYMTGDSDILTYAQQGMTKIIEIVNDYTSQPLLKSNGLIHVRMPDTLATILGARGDATPAIAPTISVTTPSTATHNTTSSTISISGTASDDGSVASVTWSNDRGGNGTATGTTSWSVADIALQEGDNVITVTATDNESNTATDVITVTRTVAPVSSSSGSNGAGSYIMG